MSEALRLLLIEDAARDARALREMLADVEDTPPPLLRHVGTMAAAERALATEPFDCILLDLRLPDSEGVESVQRIRQQHREVTLVVLTGNSDQQSALVALQHGAQDYVIKGTLDAAALMRLLRHAVERNRLVIGMERARQAEYHRATHDPLTGLPNRPLFNDRVRTALAQRRSGQLALCFVDLDGFKAVNDQQGHAAGDALLRAVAVALQEAVRAGDTVARLGGDEFAVLLTQARDADEAALVAQRMVERVAALSGLDAGTRQIGASIGLALHPADGSDCEQLLASADRAMYLAKAAGKGQWRFCTPGPGVSATTRPSGFDTGALTLCYQPWYDARSRRCSGLEALIRLDGHSSADTALKQAEVQQSLPRLGRWVLQQACSDWLALPSPPAQLAINISAVELGSRDYADSTLRLLQHLGMPATALQLEIAEDEIADAADTSPLLQQLASLRRHGIRIALDRFGRSQAALGRLASLPVDVVKLDGRHVRELRSGPLARAFIHSVLGYASALGHDTILCGVENDSDLANLHQLPAGFIQGYGLAPPLAPGASHVSRLPC